MERADGTPKKLNRMDAPPPAASILNRHKRPSMARRSIMPTAQPRQTIFDVSKRFDNKDLEMKFLYDKYLQSEMMKLLMRKKADECEKSIVAQLGTIVKEEDAMHNELLVLKNKERDVKSLVELQDSLDNQIGVVKAALHDFGTRPAEILVHLGSMLESLDVLKTKNLIVPETKEGIMRIKDLFENCRCLLRSINDLIGPNGDTAFKVNKGLKDFAKTYSNVHEILKKSEEALEELQILVLKQGANSITVHSSKFSGD